MMKFHAQRLAKLARYMKTVDEDQFYLGNWIDGNYNNLPKLVDVVNAEIRPGHIVTQEVLHSCGTTACLLGHAATMPEFRKRGLKLIIRSYHYYGVVKNVSRAVIRGEVVLRDEHTNLIIAYDSIRAGQYFFGLDYQEALELFTERGYGGVEYYDIKPYHTVDLIISTLCAHGFDDVAATI